VRQRGKETYKLKLTNKNYKDYNGLESGKQAHRQMIGIYEAGRDVNLLGDNIDAIKKNTYLLGGLSPQGNYTDRVTAACWRS
jgi:hypothetical protein